MPQERVLISEWSADQNSERFPIVKFSFQDWGTSNNLSIRNDKSSTEIFCGYLVGSILHEMLQFAAKKMPIENDLFGLVHVVGLVLFG